jgi:hypothetical protein
MDDWKCYTAAKIKFWARSCFYQVEYETVDRLGVRELNYCPEMGSLNQRVAPNVVVPLLGAAS